MSQAILPFPNIDPIIFQVGPLALRWYAVSYIVGILLGWWLILRLMRFWKPQPATADQIGDLVVWAMLGIVIGGRLGWDLIYGVGLCSISEPKAAFCGDLPMDFIRHPLRIISVWEGGMSFHGGLLGVAIAVWLFCRKNKLNLLKIADLVALVAPVGLFFGRIANFINGELWGRPTDVPWAMIFPHADGQARHPSQLYEAALEGLVLFALLQVALRVMRAQEKPGQIAGLFFLFYGAFRFIAEFFREPDGVFIGPISMGMALSIPLWIAAFLFFHFSFKKNP
jgi:phosphatidylglycerol:prolipoprotein diacylglycerol transferase